MFKKLLNGMLPKPLPDCSQTKTLPTVKEDVDALTSASLSALKEVIVENRKSTVHLQENLISVTSRVEAIAEALQLQEFAGSDRATRDLVTHLNDCVVVMDNDGKVILYNQAAEKTFGYKATEAINNSITAIIKPKVAATILAEKPQSPIVTRVKTKGSPKESKEIEISCTYFENVTFLVIRDITASQNEKKKLKALLNERNQFWLALNSIANVGIFITNAKKPDNPIIAMNKGVSLITSYTQEELLGKNPRILQGDDTKQEELEILRNAIKNHKACNVVLRNYTKDGKMFYCDLHLTPVFSDGYKGQTLESDEDKELELWVGVFYDVTERRKARQQIEKQRQFFETVINNAPIGIALHDEALNTILANSHALISGFTGQAGSKLSDMHSGESLPELKALTNAVLTERAMQLKEYVNKQGIYAAMHSYVEDPNGKPLLLTCLTDTKELHKAQETIKHYKRLHFQALSSLPFGIYVVKAKSKTLMYANKASERYFGLPYSDLIGKDFSFLFPEAEEFCNWHDDVIEGVLTNKETKVVTKKFTAFNLSDTLIGPYECIYTFSLIETDDGPAVMVVVLDISNLESSKLELAKALTQFNATLFDGISLPVIYADEYGTINYVNSAACTFLKEGSKHSLIGHKLKAYLEGESVKSLEAMDALLTKQGQQCFKATFKIESNYIECLMHRNACYSEDGNFIGSVCCIIDISEITSHTKRLNALSKAIESSSDLIALLDSNFQIVYANETFRRIYQIGEGSTWEAAFTPINYPAFLTSAKELAMKGKAWSGLLVAKTKGNLLTLQTSLQPASNGIPGVTAYLLLTQSIVESDKNG